MLKHLLFYVKTLTIMRTFRTMYQYMDEPERFVPEDSGENIVQPDLSLSPKEIMERWVRNQPLDTLQRNGTFQIDKGVEPTDEDFDTQDTDLMDMVDEYEYLATKVTKVPKEPKQAETTDPGGERDGEGAAASEPSKAQQGDQTTE